MVSKPAGRYIFEGVSTSLTKGHKKAARDRFILIASVMNIDVEWIDSSLAAAHAPGILGGDESRTGNEE